MNELKASSDSAFLKANVKRQPPKQADEFGEGVDIDENVRAKLPAGCKILSVQPSGQSLWVETVKISLLLEDGSKQEVFKKGASGAKGERMMHGAFESEKLLHEHNPDHVPRPIAWGTYKSQPDTHFFISEFVDMLDDVPSSRAWASAVAALHLNSMGKSPEGKFGLHVNTHLANVPVNNAWNVSWAEFWAQQMKSLLDQDEEIHGPDDEYTELQAKFFDVVIPRLLEPLEAEGRSIKPCLIHSDLWPGNIKPKLDEDEVCMFDSSGYWGHNEADLAICRNPRYRLGTPYAREYWKLVPISEPQEDLDDRNALYAIKFHVLLAIMYQADTRFRRVAIDEMKALVDKVTASMESKLAKL